MPINIRQPCCALIALIVSTLTLSAGAQVTVLTNASVIDATGAPVQEGMTLVIDGNVISALTPGPYEPTGDEDEIIDLNGAYVTPGFWNHACAPERATAPQPCARRRKRRRQGHSSGRQCNGRLAPRLYRAALSR